MMIEAHLAGLSPLTALAAATGFILAHNLWAVASPGRAAAGERRLIALNTSDRFPTSESAVAPDRVAEFLWLSADSSATIRDYRVAGESLVAEVIPSRAGTWLAALALRPRPIILDAEKFNAYLAEEGADAAIAARALTGAAILPGREIYTKYAKAIVEVGGRNDWGFARVAGHRLEIIPGQAPAAGGRLPVQILFDGAPIAGLRVSSGREGLRGGAYSAHAVTDRAGRAVIEVDAPGRWFIRTHHIRPHEDPAAADWESFWSSLTFEI